MKAIDIGAEHLTKVIVVDSYKDGPQFSGTLFGVHHHVDMIAVGGLFGRSQEHNYIPGRMTTTLRVRGLPGDIDLDPENPVDIQE